MEWTPSLPIPFWAGDFGSPQPPATGTLDPLDAKFHRCGYALLHCPPESNPAFKLERHILRDELGIGFHPPDLLDIDGDLPLGHFPDLFLEFVDLRAFLTNDDSRAGRTDGDLRPIGCPLDLHLGNPGVIKLLFNVSADDDVLLEKI